MTQAGTGVAAIGFNGSSSALSETTSTKAGIGLQRGSAFGVGALCFYNNNSGTSGDFTTADEKMRIDSSGNLLVGTTTQGGTAKLTIAGAVGATIGYLCHAGGSAGNAFGNVFNFFWTGSALQAWIDGSNIGNVTLVSDYRIKQNIETNTTPALERIAQIRPVTYEFADYKEVFKADGVAREGFIAHELQAIIPSAVEGEKDAEDQIQSLKLDALCSVMVKAIQELKAIIDLQQTQITALNAKVGI